MTEIGFVLVFAAVAVLFIMSGASAERAASSDDAEDVYRIAAGVKLRHVFSRMAWTTEEEDRWQRDIDAEIRNAKALTDPRWTRAYLRCLDSCQYKLDQARRVNASLRANAGRYAADKTRWEANYARAKMLLATDPPNPAASEQERK